MAFGFPARYEESHRFNLHPDYLSPAAAQAVASLGWRVYAGNPYQLSARAPFNLLSYGEDVTITIYQDGTVHAASKLLFGLFDWGRNKSNVNKFFMQLMAVSGYQPLS